MEKLKCCTIPHTAFSDKELNKKKLTFFYCNNRAERAKAAVVGEGSKLCICWWFGGFIFFFKLDLNFCYVRSVSEASRKQIPGYAGRKKSWNKEKELLFFYHKCTGELNLCYINKHIININNKSDSKNSKRIQKLQIKDEILIYLKCVSLSMISTV